MAGEERLDRYKALERVSKALLADHKLIPGDFGCVQAVELSGMPCEQGQTGVLVQFAITNHALGKVATPVLSEDINTLLGYERT